MLTGRLLAESFAAGSDLTVPGLRVTAVARGEVGASRSAGQPAVWTLVDVEGPDELADELAEAWSAGLVPDQPYYADFRVAGDHVVVFAGRIFRYPAGDRAGRQAAVDYGLKVGVPAPQLDWN